MLAGKFKSSTECFRQDALVPLSGVELLSLLRETDYTQAAAPTPGGGSGGISDTDLERLLDRSDLMTRWTERLRGGPTAALRGELALQNIDHNHGFRG